MNLISKALYSLKKRGLLETTRRTIRYPFRSRVPNPWELALSLPTPEARFTEIFDKGYWTDAESISGAGSNMANTSALRAKLPELISGFSIKTIFDAPCGDFHWMKSVVEETHVEYIGGDIVRPLIAKNNEAFASSHVKFLHFDLTADPFPNADLWFCHDCLLHLSFADTFRALDLFARSKIPFALITTAKNFDYFQNADIVTGDCRLVDLFSEPYSLDKNVLARTDDSSIGGVQREMCLWSRQQIANCLRAKSR